MHVLLEAAKKAEISLPEYLATPWFLAEFTATVEIIQRWHKKPIWKELEPSLVNPNHFTHTISKLRLAEHMEHLGHKVRITPRGKNASPDLIVQLYGVGSLLNIECYQPAKLSDESQISKKNLDKIVKHSMEKAKRQLPENTPGILAICGFNQPRKILATLKRTLEERLKKTERPNLCGILTLFSSVLYSRRKTGQRLTPMMNVDFVHNPSYFGRIIIGDEEPEDDPRLIKTPLKEIAEGKLLHENKISSKICIDSRTSTLAEMGGGFIKKNLKLVDKPAHKSRAVIHSRGILPLFEGKGNTNYLCGRCGIVLVKNAWKFSLSNIVIECPTCQSFNEFPKLKKIELPILGSVAFAKGDYYFRNWVVLIPGACLVGL